ncbi:MAG: hypothetical protein ACXADH_10735 [Candidatus Kariarchaeaceae archaeon]|jgi:hypothetical protein
MNLIEELCKDQPEGIQTMIKAAYWQGCADGVVAANSKEAKVERIEDNVVYLRK